MSSEWLLILLIIVLVLIIGGSALTRDEDMSDDPRDMDDKFFY